MLSADKATTHIVVVVTVLAGRVCLGRSLFLLIIIFILLLVLLLRVLLVETLSGFSVGTVQLIYDHEQQEHQHLQISWTLLWGLLVLLQVFVSEM